MLAYSPNDRYFERQRQTLTCCALSDAEEPNPAFRIAAMPDNDDRDAPLTDAAPPPSEPLNERPTQPPDPIDEALAVAKMNTMLPGKRGDSYFAEAARDFAASLVEMRGTRADIAAGFRAQEAKQSERHAETTANQQLVASAIRAHADRLIALERGADHVAGSIGELKEEIRLARAAADEAVILARRALETVTLLEGRLPKAEPV